MYLKGYTNTLNIPSYQCDLGIEIILEVFSEKGLIQIFDLLDPSLLSSNSLRMYSLQEDYINTIDPVITFLQQKNDTLAYRICNENYLPKASRFDNIDDLEWSFGSMGIRDKARHLATLYLEDLSDLITENIDPYFGFSRYAEKLALSATSFDELHAKLQSEYSFIDTILVDLLDQKLKREKPTLACITAPFPGNVYGAFRCGEFIKKNYPSIKVVLGGGYANTELRSITEVKAFDYIDFITLDDGEAVLKELLSYVENPSSLILKRTFLTIDGIVKYVNNSSTKDVPQMDVGTPDYSDLPLQKYLSILEIANPMHRLWNDGRWNKLTLAHGCYWGKCSFCDITLDYIARYEPITASVLCDRIEEIILQTGETGFHFVDEAAPPSLLKDLAIEILKRDLTITWWTNIRFEKSFTNDLCKLLAASGCIAVSGGLEVASDRLLTKMKKGVTVAQVANVCNSFTENGIMVHAYLMYGFPTQTSQETVDSLEMVRQLFELGIIQSGFWHQFSMTTHSPVGLNPDKFDVQKIGPKNEGFADNDLLHQDFKGTEHELFSEGLKKSLYNYMHGVGFDFELSEWFEHEIPSTSIPHDYIQNSLIEKHSDIKNSSSLLWIGRIPMVIEHDDNQLEFIFHSKKDSFSFMLDKERGDNLFDFLNQASVYSDIRITQKEANDLFIDDELLHFLREKELLVL